MKKSKLIFLIAVIAVAAITLGFSILFTPRKQYLNFVELSDGKTIASDGGGYYMDEVDGVGIDFSDVLGSITIDLNQSGRSIYVDFEKASWKDLDFNDIQPMLKSDNYRAIISIDVFELSSSGEAIPIRLTDARPGYYYSDFLILMELCDLNSGTVVGVMTRGLVPYRIVSGVIERNVIVPPPELYNMGPMDLKREGETTWVLEGNAWFELRIPFAKYYVKLSLKMTIHHEKV